MNKLTRTATGILILGALSMLFSITASAAHFSTPIETGAITGVTYKITEYNESTTTMWWDPNPDKTIFWATEIGATANLTLGTVYDDEIQVEFSTGNLSKGFQNDSTYAGALALGYWSVKEGGFVVSGNWTEIDAAFAQVGFTVYNHSTAQSSYASRSFATEQFHFEDAFGQNTTLIYDSDTGLLLEAHTGFGNYELGFVAAGFIGDYFKTETYATPFSIVIALSAFGSLTALAYLKSGRRQ